MFSSKLSAFVLLSIASCVSASPLNFKRQPAQCHPEFPEGTVAITSSLWKWDISSPPTAGSPIIGTSVEGDLFAKWIIRQHEFGGYIIHSAEDKNLLVTNNKAGSPNRTLALSEATPEVKASYAWHLDIICDCDEGAPTEPRSPLARNCVIENYAEQLCATFGPESTDPMTLEKCTHVDLDPSQVVDIWAGSPSEQC